MTRLFCLSLVVALASHLTIQAQEKKAPPKDFTNSIGMKFVWIPPGSFMMGFEEKNQHKVTLTKGFFMAVYTVTQEEWLALMGEDTRERGDEKKLPMNVSWNGCQGFIKKMREKDKKPYRLPTEAEWEYACRAGSKGAYSFGDDPKLLGQYAWFADNSKARRHPVGQKKPNAWGLHDMHGNVMQWCQDWRGQYPQKDVVDPQGPEKGGGRVLRGSAWGGDRWDCLTAKRGEQTPDTAFSSFGFRICFSVE